MSNKVDAPKISEWKPIINKQPFLRGWWYPYQLYVSLRYEDIEVPGESIHFQTFTLNISNIKLLENHQDHCGVLLGGSVWRLKS